MWLLNDIPWGVVTIVLLVGFALHAMMVVARDDGGGVLRRKHKRED